MLVIMRLFNGSPVFRRQQVHVQRNLLRRRVTSQLLGQAPLHAHLAVDAFDHVHRDADRARLVGDRPAYRLADPPGGVGAELEAQAVIEFLNCPQQADVALLDEVAEVHAPANVAFGDTDDEPQVGVGQPLLSTLTNADDAK